MSDLNEKLYGHGLVGVIKPTLDGVLRKKFLVPPFTVLSARDGFWQDRKRAWLALGLEGDIGRSASPGGSPMPSARYSEDGARGDGHGKTVTASGRKANLTWNIGIAAIDQYRVKEGIKTRSDVQSTSMFDPVLCELCYQWFCPVGGQVLDPFAGGSVRGIIAHALGRRYWGCDLRPEQVISNVDQGAKIVPDNQPTWVCGDSLVTVDSAPEADFVFSCPPYGSLEKYSDDERDLSRMKFGEFCRAYTEIINKSCGRLRQNRFACFVVGDFRDDEGNYRNFVGGTIKAFLKAGLKLYNEAVLVTAVASLSLRTENQFTKSRKLGKTHQNILVFLKGDAKLAAAAINDSEEKSE